MKLYLYSIKDKLSDFQGVMTIRDDEMALRIFEGYCRKQKAENYSDAKYYDLYKVGEYDSESGVVIGYTKQEMKLLKEGEQYDE